MIPTAPKPKPVEGQEPPKGFEPPKTGVSLSIHVTADKPTGTTVLTGARIVTMAGADGGVIENGIDRHYQQPHHRHRPHAAPPPSPPAPAPSTSPARPSSPA